MEDLTMSFVSIDAPAPFETEALAPAHSTEGTPHPHAAGQIELAHENTPGTPFSAAATKTLTDPLQDDFSVSQFDNVEVLGESDYSPVVIKKMYKFFYDAEKYRTVTETIYMKDGSYRDIEKDVPNPPPHFSTFARSIGVHKRVLDLWREKHPEFELAYQDCTEVIKEFIIDNGLVGHYQGNFAIYVGNNLTDMRNTKELNVKKFNVNSFLDNLQKKSAKDSDRGITKI